MMFPAREIWERAEKIMRLRRGYPTDDGTVVRVYEAAQICTEFGQRLYKRGHTIIEWEYGA